MGDNMMIKGELSEVGKSQVLDYHILEGIADWVRVVNNDGIIVYANKAMKNDLGEDIVGIPCSESHCGLNSCNFCITMRSIETGETIQKEEKIGANFYSVKSSPVMDSNGDIYAAVEVFRDVTRERKLEYELIGKNKKINRDLQFAKRIQEKILPRKGSRESVRLDYIYKPSDILSGDMFDMFNIDDEHIGIYISDVSGKGIAASMMTMFIRESMRIMKEDIKASSPSPSLALSNLHKRFLALNLEVDSYFTMFYGIYNHKTRIFKYANAGHNCIPIKYNDDNMDLLYSKGLPITSLFNNIAYKEKSIPLKLGDKIFFYTDGITEARDSSGNEFGLEEVIKIIKESKKDVLNIIEDNIINHSWGEQQDDFAIVLLEVIN
ncbi:MAG TPA: SpoIIE family protein phosphatase [Tissierellaceae bacterium]|nr:SpoIIE family protein phosphatase [Tissierellaceae bacterium]